MADTAGDFHLLFQKRSEKNGRQKAKTHTVKNQRWLCILLRPAMSVVSGVGADSRCYLYISLVLKPVFCPKWM